MQQWLTGPKVTRKVLPGALTLLLLALVPAGCSSDRSVTPEEQRTPVRFADFAILPPAGPAWVHAGRGKRGVAYGRRLSPTHSLLALAETRQTSRSFAGVDEVMTFLRGVWARRTAAGSRYRNQHANARPDPASGAGCVRYRLDSEDTRAVNRGDAPFLVLRATGLYCIVPAHPGRMVHVGFSERSLPGETLESFESDAAGFLAGFHLNPAS